MKTEGIKSFVLVLGGITLGLVLTGCITTQIKGYTDPSYQGREYRHVIVAAPDASFNFRELLEGETVAKLQAVGIEAVSDIALFPPTREWNSDQVHHTLSEMGVEAGILISLAGTASSDDVIGYHSTGSATSYGGYTSARATTIPMRAISRSTGTRVTLQDIKSGETVWIGDARTDAGGFLFVGDKATAASMASKIVNTLKAQGHLPERGAHVSGKSTSANPSIH